MEAVSWKVGGTTHNGARRHALNKPFDFKHATSRADHAHVCAFLFDVNVSAHACAPKLASNQNEAFRS
jgi:hypothetical protein